MSDFMDFLRHKYAYVARGEFKPGKFDEAKELFDRAIATYTQGFEGAYLLQEPDTDRGIAVIFWDTPEDMDANRNETVEEILAQMSHLFAKPPETAFYEVSSEIHKPVAVEA
ncbi:MAG: antibiotic biosynthesis monooxygenase [Cyanobacteria bacterium SID2]|nr:antibiotic biosynthesis monooxygenase [Cyanobacteria bacterium SID2]MBP0004955.1 antibiotic biosynthesis monooxygenase [Cyanobacteria bacterium SBC]